MTKKNKNTKKGAVNEATDQAILESQVPVISPPNAKQISHYDTQMVNKYLKAPLGKYNWRGLKCKDRLALVMMIKNEEKRIEVSYDSVRQYTDTFVILDTGSTDRTIEITRAYCKKHNITLHLAEIPFVDFEKSRNDLLDFADEVLKNHYFMMLLDCNDELRNHSELVKVIENHNGPQSGFHLRQQWWTGGSLDTYFNIRMVISHFGWRYRGVVHEYIARNPGQDGANDILKCDDVILYQDRTLDDDKSQRRFKRDKILLHTAHLRIPEDPRTLFYLAQTCNCLNQVQESYEYNLLRTKYTGFGEEVYHSYHRLGMLSQRLKHPWEESLGWYLKAYSHSKRAEPLVNIAEYYMENDSFGNAKPDWHLAFCFIQQACKLNFPHAQILFIDKNVYIYRRWHLMGRIGFYCNRYREGKDGCVKALMNQDSKIDMDNLLHYLKKDQELIAAVQNPMHNQEFLSSLDIMMSVSSNVSQDDAVPVKEKGLGVGNAFTEEDIIKRARQRLNGL
ncbi:MAG: glycosyltransferase [Alphaproteobacteria bacterium]|nr:glycosyltransferase [Alphaproteobacteria bacterium]